MIRKLFSLIALCVLAACAQLPPVNSQIAIAYGVTSDYLDRTMRLYDAQIISQAEAADRVRLVRKASNALKLATAALNSCAAQSIPESSCSGAQDQIAVANAVLNEVEIYLLKKEVAK